MQRLSRDSDFIHEVFSFYSAHGRHGLLWRQTRDPYLVLLSELMLQQTQVERVVPKYKTFIKNYPTIFDLAKSELGDVIRLWQGLGYNRRARYLYDTARKVVEVYGGIVPQSEEILKTLPGIGPYTARAVMAFSFEAPVAFIETNIRTVFIHHYFEGKKKVGDRELYPLIERTLQKDCVRDWYYALMDYGSFLKKTRGNNISQSKHYTKQSRFKGSDREIRGAIVRDLSSVNVPKNHADLCKLGFDVKRTETQLHALVREGLIVKTKRGYMLP